MNDLQQSLGVEIPIRFVVQDNGSDVVLLFSPMTFRIKAEFGDYVKSKARQELFAMRSLLDSDTFANICAKFARDAGTGVYQWGKPASMEAISADDGVVQFVLLLLKRNQPHLEAEGLRDLMSRHTEAFRQQIKEIMETDAKN